MLLQFYFSNYKSFENEGTLDMRASGSNELSFHIRNTADHKVLPISVIYGANASGKSSVFEAFNYMSYYVLNSLSFFDDKKDNDSIIRTNTFKFSKKIEEASEFEVSYISKSGNKKKFYSYGFKIDEKGVLEEYLLSNTKTGIKKKEKDIQIFHRKRNEKLELNSSLEEYRNNLGISLKDRTLLVSLGSALNIEELKMVRDWFLKIENINFSNSLYGAFLENTLPDEIENREVRSALVQFLNSFDDSIVDIEIEKIASDKIRKEYRVFAVHKCEDGNRRRISLSEESSGTQKMFSLYQVIRNILDSGGVFFADELDIKLHPLLMRNIILTFTDKKKNPKNAQLIFTTHNTIYMDMGLLRRDEIWFVEKNKGVSELYSLDDITNEKGEKVRKDSNYEKHYLLGNYGAVPYLKNLLGSD